ncbi:MAG: exodeoxyribonuclease VII large subunit [Lachnospiraceae bacterium]|nr:exodeoxyribonuclease VII large subunit [Lachnospiraceae bacterium]
MNKKIYSVGQVNRYISRLLLDDVYLQSISISGEVSNLKYHQSGHIYFSLKDQTAAISCVMFAGQRRGLAFPMKNGDKVVVTGTVKAFERDGTYELIARQITLSGEGMLYEAFVRLRDELKESGYFDPRYKKPIPKYASRIGIVTAPSGAAVWDIVNVARRRNPYVQLILCPAYVEGPEAKHSIAEGIRRLDGTVDLMIVGRGGGSLEQLWAFNEREVADAIMECSTPVVSAVGHEVDTTIADYVADLRAATPTEAAELTVFDYREFENGLADYRASLEEGFLRRTEAAKNRCLFMEAKLAAFSPNRRMEDGRRRAAELQDRLTQRMEARVSTAEQRYGELYDRCDSLMQNRMQQLAEICRMKGEQLDSGMQKNLSAYRHRLDVYVERFAGRNPLERLQQGYSYTENEDHHAVTSVRQVKKEDSLYVYVTDGKIKARAEEIYDGFE